MRRAPATTLAALMTLAGAASAFLLPAPATTVSRSHSPARTPVALQAAAAEASAIGMAQVIPEAELTEADKTPPPSTFFECTLQAYNAAAAALADGHQLLEIEFPPLSAADMANQASSANTIGAANIRLATDVAKYFAREGKRVVILVPDKDELDLIEEGMGTLEPAEGVDIRSVRARSAESAESMTDLLFGIFTRASKCVLC